MILRDCSCCSRAISRAEWATLPPALGGLRAMGGEWRNCGCGSTLMVPLKKLNAWTVRPAARMAVAS